MAVMAGRSIETRIRCLRTPWSRRIVELLADGDWHDATEIITEAAKAVPPGVAYRCREDDRNRKREAPGPRVRGDDHTSIDVGAREVTHRALRELCRTSRKESPLVERSAAGYMVRLAR